MAPEPTSQAVLIECNKILGDCLITQTLPTSFSKTVMRVDELSEVKSRISCTNMSETVELLENQSKKEQN